jgi:adhesin/invasin
MRLSLSMALAVLLGVETAAAQLVQQGPKLVGWGDAGGINQGLSVALSTDGTTAIVGGWADNGNVGAAWIFAIPTPAGLAFGQQPTVTVAGATMAPALTVQIQDAYGNPAAVAGVTVTVSLTSGTGILSGTAGRSTDPSGVATFDDLSIDIAGAKQLTAESSGLTSTVSDLFTIVAGAPAAIAVTGGGTLSTPTGTLFPAVLQVRVTDALGNPVSGATVTFTAPASGASAVLGNGGTATTDAGGYASVSATANGVPRGPDTVTAAVATVTPAPFSLTNVAPLETAVPALGGPGLAALALLLAAAGALIAGRPQRG